MGAILRTHPSGHLRTGAVSTVDDLQHALDAVKGELIEARRQLEAEEAELEGSQEDATSEGDADDGLAERTAAIAGRELADSAAAGALATATAQTIDAQVAAAFEELVPKFFYFDDVFFSPGMVSVERITDAVITGNEQGLTDTEVAAARFLRSVHLEPGNLDPARSERLKTELEAIGVELTNRVQEFWHQNPHVEFKMFPENIEEDHPQGGGKRIVDRRLKFRVYDGRHQASTPFTARSTGFRWFVSFLAEFAYYAEGRKDVVVLLDEPGVSLHATAQADLLGYIDDQLVPNQQVLYTTHSAWMVPVRKIHRVRTVEEDLNPKISSGATVSGKMLAKDR